jgi:hypothetical protein
MKFLASELREISHKPTPPNQRSGGQFSDHEYLVGHCELAAQSVRRPGTKAEPRVELRMPDHDDRLAAGAPALAQTGFDELRADAVPLQFREYCHGTKTERRDCGSRRIDGDGREQNVADDPLAFDGHEGKGRVPGLADRVDQARLVELTEGGIVQIRNRDLVTGLFGPDVDGDHDGLRLGA